LLAAIIFSYPRAATICGRSNWAARCRPLLLLPNRRPRNQHSLKLGAVGAADYRLRPVDRVAPPQDAAHRHRAEARLRLLRRNSNEKTKSKSSRPKAAATIAKSRNQRANQDARLNSEAASTKATAKTKANATVTGSIRLQRFAGVDEGPA
jgi:hypothetical protein